MPELGLVAREAGVGNGGNIRRKDRTLCACNGQNTQAGNSPRQRIRCSKEAELKLPGYRVGRLLCGSCTLLEKRVVPASLRTGVENNAFYAPALRDVRRA